MKISAAALLVFSAVQAPFIVTKASAETIVEFLADETNEHTTLYEKYVQTDVISTLEGNGTFTVFAVKDEYFNSIFPMTRDCYANITEELEYHIAEGMLTFDTLTDGTKIPFLNGLEGTVEETKFGNIVIWNAQRSIRMLVYKDQSVVLSNGVVHVVDEMILTPDTHLEVCDLNEFITISSAHTFFSGTSFMGAAALMIAAGAFLAI